MHHLLAARVQDLKTLQLNSISKFVQNQRNFYSSSDYYCVHWLWEKKEMEEINDFIPDVMGVNNIRGLSQEFHLFHTNSWNLAK